MIGLVGLILIFGRRRVRELHRAVLVLDQIDLNNVLHGPTLKGHHFFGTDEIGRDYFSRVIYGIRTSEEVGVFVAVVSSVFGLMLGAIAGYYGGWIDNLLMRLHRPRADAAGARDPADRCGASSKLPRSNQWRPCRSRSS